MASLSHFPAQNHHRAESKLGPFTSGHRAHTRCVPSYAQPNFGQLDGPIVFDHTILLVILICIRFSRVMIKPLQAWAIHSSHTLELNNWHIEAHGLGKEKNK